MKKNIFAGFYQNFVEKKPIKTGNKNRFFFQAVFIALHSLQVNTFGLRKYIRFRHSYSICDDESKKDGSKEQTDQDK